MSEPTDDDDGKEGGDAQGAGRAGLPGIVRRCFEGIADPVSRRGGQANLCELGRVPLDPRLLRTCRRGRLLVCPDGREVFPPASAPVMKADGSAKNDCDAQAR